MPCRDVPIPRRYACRLGGAGEHFEAHRQHGPAPKCIGGHRREYIPTETQGSGEIRWQISEWQAKEVEMQKKISESQLQRRRASHDI